MTDNTPIIIEPIFDVVDETNLGPIVEMGSVEADFFGEGPGTIAGNGTFTFNGPAKDGNLTSGGVPVSVTKVGDTYIGTAGSVTVFEISIAANGDYTFTLYEPLDHESPSTSNEAINLNFGITATDADGDTDTAFIRVRVLDDEPVANNDSESVVEGGSVSGNITDNDAESGDSPTLFLNVTFDGTEYTVPETGTIDIPGQFGTLTIDASGEYTYVVTDTNNPDGIDTFTYTLEDFDGDVDTATLNIQVTPNDTIPVIIEPIFDVVDETNLGPIVEMGSVEADFFGEGPGTIAGGGTFTFNGPAKDGNLTSNGIPVTVNLVGNTYTGTAGGTTVFEISIAANGDYTFTLYEPLDHASPNTSLEAINLNFGITATDADGDTDAAFIRVRVLDDAPEANTDVNVFEDDTTSGNVLDGTNGGNNAADKLSSDGSTLVNQVAFDGTVTSVGYGTTIVDGEYGRLEISSDGSYTYELFDEYKAGNADPGFVSDFDPTRSDIYNKQNSLTLNGITVAPGTPTDNYTGPAWLSWVDEGNGAGVGILSYVGPAKIWKPNEVLDITFEENPSIVQIDIADITGRDLQGGVDFKIHIVGQDQPVEFELDISTMPAPTDGILRDITFNAADFGGELIEKIEVFSIHNSNLRPVSFVVNNIHAELPAEEVSVPGTDIFEYQIVDGDGDTSSSYLVFNQSNGEALNGTNLSETINGTAEDDVIYGAGGDDELYGNGGSDVFLFLSTGDDVDTIGDFSINDDQIDLSNLLEAYNPADDLIDDFIYTTTSGGSTTVSVDVNGTGNQANAVDIVTLEGVDTDLAQLLSQENLVA